MMRSHPPRSAKTKRSFDFGLAQARLYRSDHSDIILQRKDIVCFAIITFRPDMRAGFGRYEKYENR